MTSALFSPIRLADLELANRIVVSPMCQYSADDGVASDWHTTHLGMLANSGAALVVVEATGIERRGRITHGCLGLYSDDCEAALARVIAHCRRYGTAKLGIQLAHAGRKASAPRPWEGGQALKPEEDPWETIAPSAIPFGPDWHVPREMTVADMERVRDGFVAAAKRAVRAGSTPSSCTARTAISSTASSRRSPTSVATATAVRSRRACAIRWRSRTPCARSCRRGCRSARASPAVTGSRAATPDDAVAFARALKGAGLDFVCISSGGISADARPAVAANTNVAFAEQVKREAGIVTRAVGLIATPKQAEAIVAEGKADMVALARAMLDDPHWAWHAAHALGAEVARPKQYQRAAPKMWAGAAYRDARME